MLWHFKFVPELISMKRQYEMKACSLTIWKAYERTTLDEITILDQPLKPTGFFLQYYRYKRVQIQTPPYGFVHTAKTLTGGKD